MPSELLWCLLAVAFAAAAAELENETSTVSILKSEEPDPYELPDESVDYHSSEEDEDDDLSDETVVRKKRDIHESFEQIRVKRCCEDRIQRSADYVRKPRQVHQYEVHEFTDEHDPSSPPYEEMLAASADHYQRVYAAPRAPKTARYLNPDVSSANVLPGPSNHQLLNHAQTQPPQNVLSRPSNQHIYQGQISNQPHQNQPPNRGPTFNQPLPQPNQQTPFLSKLQAPADFAHVSSPVSHEVPLSVASIPLVPIQLDGDQSVAAGHQHQQKHSRGHSQGGGEGNHAKHHKEQGGKATEGFNQDHYVDKGGKGHKTDELHRKEYEEALGKKKKHHDHAGHKGSHSEEAHGHRGAKFDEKKGHKKGHKTKGYHNKYHKDEFHKEHKFYDDYHKSGEHHRFGKFNAKHASNESGKKKAHHVNAGHDYVEKGKKGYSNKGHVDADHKGHDGKHGHEEHHQHHSSHGKKGGKEGGSQWGYAKKH